MLQERTSLDKTGSNKTSEINTRALFDSWDCNITRLFQSRR